MLYVHLQTWIRQIRFLRHHLHLQRAQGVVREDEQVFCSQISTNILVNKDRFGTLSVDQDDILDFNVST